MNMEVELIPVISIEDGDYYHENVSSPKNGPSWDYPNEWNEYNSTRFLLSGFKDLGASYLPGSVFYRPTNINDDNLIRIIQNHTEDLAPEEYELYGICALSGGYVLRVNGRDILFPQCCGDLENISYWEDMAFAGKKSYNIGHPQPACEIHDQEIILGFERPENDESFAPPPPVDRIVINKSALQNAIVKTKGELQQFGQRLIELNNTAGLNIPDIEDYLVWGGKR